MNAIQRLESCETNHIRLNATGASEPMPDTAPDTAMILAAGLGTRMRPITDTMPKPLVPVDGKPLIDYAIDSLLAADVNSIIVNVHYHADQLVKHLAHRTEGQFTISDESDQLLDSGGGVAKALPLLGQNPFFILNADTFWLEEERASRSNLAIMADVWDVEKMDILLMTVTLDQVVGHNGKLDFDRDVDGRLKRHVADATSFGDNVDAVIYAGAILINPAIFRDAPNQPFSLNRCFDAAIAKDRLFGSPMHGLWLTVGTPEAIEEVETAMAAFHADTASAAGAQVL